MIEISKISKRYTARVLMECDVEIIREVDMFTVYEGKKYEV